MASLKQTVRELDEDFDEFGEAVEASILNLAEAVRDLKTQVSALAAGEIRESMPLITLDGRTLRIGAASFLLPIPIYRGVWEQGQAYSQGDMVTRDGSMFHCDRLGAGDPRQDGTGWTLATKRGKDAARK